MSAGEEGERQTSTSRVSISTCQPLPNSIWPQSHVDPRKHGTSFELPGIRCDMIPTYVGSAGFPEAKQSFFTLIERCRVLNWVAGEFGMCSVTWWGASVLVRGAEEAQRWTANQLVTRSRIVMKAVQAPTRLSDKREPLTVPDRRPTSSVQSLSRQILPSLDRTQRHATCALRYSTTSHRGQSRTVFTDV